jgi:hypothetical protein
MPVLNNIMKTIGKNNFTAELKPGVNNAYNSAISVNGNGR